MGKVKMVFLATRPWSFPMTVLIGLIAGLAGCYNGYSIDWILLTIGLIGSVLLHAMVNVLNDYYDTKRGLDRRGVGTVEYRPHPILHQILSPGETLVLGIISGIAGLILAALVWYLGRPLAIPLGLIGFILAYIYTGPPFPLKYNALGEIGVYLAWGIVIPIGNYYLATGGIDLTPVIIALPMAILVVNVLLANNLRDIEADKAGGIKTLATVLGFGSGRKLFKVLIILAYIIPIFYLPVKYTLFLATLPVYLTLKGGLNLSKMMDEGKAPPDADPRVAGVLQKYAILYLAGIIIVCIAGIVFK
ncbi:MAG: prenyltransferase [Desulfurococcales archaeon]|nr:prenyltransferase [Desulfurococcales archaeon]